MKCFIVNGDGKHYFAVATKTKKEALILLKASESHYRNYGRSILEGEIEAYKPMFDHPGVVYRRRIHPFESPWEVKS